jgi:hypothetical protein
MKTPIAAVKSSGAEPPAAMKVAPATSSLIPPAKMRLFYTGAKKSLAAMKVAPDTSSIIPPVTKRGYFTLKQKNTPAAMKFAPATTSSIIPPVTKRGYCTLKQKNQWQP